MDFKRNWEVSNHVASCFICWWGKKICKIQALEWYSVKSDCAVCVVHFLGLKMACAKFQWLLTSRSIAHHSKLTTLHCQTIKKSKSFRIVSQWHPCFGWMTKISQTHQVGLQFGKTTCRRSIIPCIFVNFHLPFNHHVYSGYFHGRIMKSLWCAALETGCKWTPGAMESKQSSFKSGKFHM